LAEEITFTSKVQALGRVAIPKEIRSALKIGKGDLVTITVQKIHSAVRKSGDSA
jgi:AbrB family looped-hinge helix DNA binding protein